MRGFPAISVVVSQLEPLAQVLGIRPAHHCDDTNTTFQNPWDSWGNATEDLPSGWYSMVRNATKRIYAFQTERRKHAQSGLGVYTLKVHKPTWGDGLSPSNLKATWLGHACFLVEFPVPPAAFRGSRVLFDPAFSHRCSPSQYIGPARHAPPPCKIEEIPDVDAVVISHNHYDHFDNSTIQALMRQPTMPHFFAPLGNASHLESLGIPQDHIHVLDWWDSRQVHLILPSPNGDTSLTSFKITSTPCQHFAGRGLSDTFDTLWSSWAIENGDSGDRSKVWFAGDTGYRSVRKGQNEDEVPVCPATKEIGEKFGGFDLAMIPIGTYAPRHLNSAIHLAPQDSVRVFKDVKATRAIGMHWGTWALFSTEPVMEPPVRLREECEKAHIGDKEFIVCDIGETVVV